MADDDPSAARQALRTVTPSSRPRPDSEMTVVGLGLFAGLIVLFVPLLPFIVIVWVVVKLLEILRGH